MPLIWILAALAVIFILETVLSEMEQWGWATVTLLATVVAAHLLNVFRINVFVMEHGWSTIFYALGFMAVGVSWSFVKWFSYLRGFRDTFRELKENFCKTKNLESKDPIPEMHIPAFKDYLERNARYPTIGDAKDRNLIVSLERPRAHNNKRRITAWMAYWPCSVIGTFLNDPVRRAFNWLFNNFKALYEKLANFVFRKDSELK